MHHIALHDFVPGLTQIAISPLGDMPVIRAEFAGLVRRRIDAGVCDESPLAMKAADISDLRFHSAHGAFSFGYIDPDTEHGHS